MSKRDLSYPKNRVFAKIFHLFFYAFNMFQWCPPTTKTSGADLAEANLAERAKEVREAEKKTLKDGSSTMN